MTDTPEPFDPATMCHPDAAIGGGPDGCPQIEPCRLRCHTRYLDGQDQPNDPWADAERARVAGPGADPVTTHPDNPTPPQEDPMTNHTRPSTYPPLSKSYAIDQITDIEHLRTVAHRMWEAFDACHQQSAHIYGVLTGHVDCPPCRAAFTGDGDAPCRQYVAWQAKVSDGFGAV